MLNRRSLLIGSLGSAALAALPFRVIATHHKSTASALDASSLVYLTPVKSDGNLSSCQAEVWYVMLGPDMYVCTATSSWRAQAPRKGLSKAKMWVGDLGSWRSADYKSLPEINARASIETDDATLEKVLGQFGLKYPAEWGTYGPRFRGGLADGSRTMLRYQLSA